MRTWQRILLGGLVLGLVGCGGGGSGSTGLVTSESVVVDDVRSGGTCDAFDDVTYCGSDSPDAIAPGGQSVSVVTTAPTPARTATAAPTANASASPAPPTPTSVAVPTATPTIGGPQATPTPVAPTATATPAPSSVTVVLDGFDDGAACAAAARPLDSAVSWRTAALVPVAASATPTKLPLPTGATPPLDLALVCYDTPPATVPAVLVTLADADPTVVFVLPSP